MAVFSRVKVAMLAIFVVFPAAACKKVNPSAESSSIKEGGGPVLGSDCACQDLACWQKATTDGSLKQLDCATDTVATVFPILGPITDLAKSAIFLPDALKAVKSVNGIASEVLEASERAGIYSPCVKNLVSASASAASFLDNFRSIGQEIDKLKPDDSIAKGGPLIKSMFQAGADLIKGITSVLSAFNSCETPASKALLRGHYAKIADVKSKAVGPLKSLMKPLDDLTKGAAAKLAVIGTIAKCVAGIADGAVTLYQNSMCLRQDLAALDESKKTVAKALAYTGSRLFNHAKYVGCTEAVGDHGTFNSAASNYNTCRSLCEQKSENYFTAAEPQKKASWTISCQLTCGVAKSSGIFYDYTDEAACNDVKGVFHVSRSYRHIDLVYPEVTDGRRMQVESARADVLANLAVLKSNFGAYDGAAGSADGLIGLTDLTAAAANQSLPVEQRSVAQFFLDYDSFWLKAVDGAGTDYQTDGVIGTTDLDYFRDEISEYRDESEMSDVQ